MGVERIPSLGSHRRIKGIARTKGDLTINGVPTKTGHVAQQIKRVVRHRDRRLLDPEVVPLGPYELTSTADNVWFEGTCEGCGKPVQRGDQARRERETGRVWHIGACCVPCHQDEAEEE